MPSLFNHSITRLRIQHLLEEQMVIKRYLLLLTLLIQNLQAIFSLIRQLRSEELLHLQDLWQAGGKVGRNLIMTNKNKILTYRESRFVRAGFQFSTINTLVTAL